MPCTYIKHPKKFRQIGYFYQKFREVNEKNYNFSLTKLFRQINFK